MNFIRSACPPRSMIRLRACWVVHSPVGYGVTPRIRMRRAACPITVRTQAWVPPGRRALKKSQARITSAWERRNCGQVGPVRRGAGSMLALRTCHTVDAATLSPRPASSPWILRYPPLPSPVGALVLSFDDEIVRRRRPDDGRLHRRARLLISRCAEPARQLGGDAGPRPRRPARWRDFDRQRQSPLADPGYGTGFTG